MSTPEEHHDHDDFERGETIAATYLHGLTGGPHALSPEAFQSHAAGILSALRKVGARHVGPEAAYNLLQDAADRVGERLVQGRSVVR